jgi:hypothetical protein
MKESTKQIARTDIFLFHIILQNITILPFSDFSSQAIGLLNLKELYYIDLCISKVNIYVRIFFTSQILVDMLTICC